MKRKLVSGLLCSICMAGLMLLSGCDKNNEEQGSSSKSKKVKVEKAAPHGVVFGGPYLRMNADGELVHYMNAISGTCVEYITVNGAVESKPVVDSEGQTKKYFHVMLDDEECWIEEQNIVLDADTGYILESGTDIYLFKNPDVDSERILKLNFDTIVASFGKCEASSEFKEASKFYRVKIFTDGEYVDGYVRLSNIDFDPSHIAYIQVSKKYNQLVNSGNASIEVLDELEDTMAELSSWSGR